MQGKGSLLPFLHFWIRLVNNLFRDRIAKNPKCPPLYIGVGGKSLTEGSYREQGARPATCEQKEKNEVI
jgi:hypothetical protein